MADIKFKSAAHRDFFLENMMKSRVNDCYHRAFFYVWELHRKRGQTLTRCLTLRPTVLCQRVCTAVGRQAERSRSATLLSISGTDMRRKDGNGFSRQRNYSAASLPRILWRALRSGIPNIAGNFPHQSSRQTMFDNEIPYGHTIMPIKWAGTKKGAINEKI